MSARSFLNGRVTLHAGDCLAVLPTLPECSVDAVCVDPPYHLQSIQKRFAKVGRDDKTWSRSDPHQRHAAGFMNQLWDGGDIAFRPETWAAVLRVLKPGGHLVAFAAPKNAHRMVCAIEDAGFEIRDTLMWLFGSGFPKSLNVSKAIDKAAGVERQLTRPGIVERNGYGDDWDTGSSHTRPRYDQPATDAARAWEGWGTALKPAYEPIVLARKPLSEGTVAANVLRWGTGALNIDGCRVASDETLGRFNNAKPVEHRVNDSDSNAKPLGRMQQQASYVGNSDGKGRWPANILHDGSEEVVAAFPETGASGVAVQRNGGGQRIGGNGVYGGSAGLTREDVGFGDSGSAARFFYTSKADADDRIGSKHPTVKPLDLMQYLVRLVTPPRGVVLDPFAGTGTTGEAAWREGFSAILIEREPEYIADIERRMKLALAGPDERAREAIKARLKDKPMDAGPLFGALA